MSAATLAAILLLIAELTSTVDLDDERRGGQAVSLEDLLGALGEWAVRLK
jgi:hypothetical protein